MLRLHVCVNYSTRRRRDSCTGVVVIVSASQFLCQFCQGIGGGSKVLARTGVVKMTKLSSLILFTRWHIISSKFLQNHRGILHYVYHPIVLVLSIYSMFHTLTKFTCTVSFFISSPLPVSVPCTFPSISVAISVAISSTASLPLSPPPPTLFVF